MKILLLVFLFLIPISLAGIMEPLDTVFLNGREITLNAIQDTKVLISVDGEKNIVSLNQQKVINGVRITVEDIFDAGELSTADLSFELAYTCGDSQCSEFETSESCCVDCGCSGSYECVINKCIAPECKLDSQCNDNNPLTEDSCSDFKCKYKKIRCENDLDCNDNNTDTDDSCNRGKCINILNYVCKIDEDCDDQNPCTTDICVNLDCLNTLQKGCEFEVPKPQEKTILEEQQEEIKNNLEEDVRRFRKNILIKIIAWLRELF